MKSFTILRLAKADHVTKVSRPLQQKEVNEQQQQLNWKQCDENKRQRKMDCTISDVIVEMYNCDTFRLSKKCAVTITKMFLLLYRCFFLCI